MELQDTSHKLHHACFHYYQNSFCITKFQFPSFLVVVARTKNIFECMTTMGTPWWVVCV